MLSSRYCSDEVVPHILNVLVLDSALIIQIHLISHCVALKIALAHAILLHRIQAHVQRVSADALVEALGHVSEFVFGLRLGRVAPQVLFLGLKVDHAVHANEFVVHSEVLVVHMGVKGGVLHRILVIRCDNLKLGFVVLAPEALTWRTHRSLSSSK